MGSGNKGTSSHCLRPVLPQDARPPVLTQGWFRGPGAPDPRCLPKPPPLGVGTLGTQRPRASLSPAIEWLLTSPYDDPQSRRATWQACCKSECPGSLRESPSDPALPMASEDCGQHATSFTLVVLYCPGCPRVGRARWYPEPCPMGVPLSRDTKLAIPDSRGFHSWGGPWRLS